ncbi:hypothetical protein AGMMS49965_21140 [Bacteroidia bacterium]|nr:hypothetical protein AGMMS49965_21140 [Bacteroidia bacterium]
MSKNTQKAAQNETQNKADEQQSLSRPEKEKFSLKKFLKNISSKLPFLSIAFWGLSAVSILAVAFLAVALRQDTFSSKKEVKNINDFASAKSEFESRTQVDTAWFQEGIKLPDTLLFVNTTDKKLIWKMQGQYNEVSYIAITSENSVKQVADTAEFDKFVAQYFSIDASDIIDTIAQKIGAKTDYITEIKKQSTLKQRDMVFSLIYNTIVGDHDGHIVVTIENKKLKIITAKDFIWDRIDADLFVQSMQWVASNDTLSNKDKFILASSKQLSNKPDTTETKFKQYFDDDNVIKTNCKLPVDFLYYDFRNDSLHIGDKKYPKNGAKSKQYLPRLDASPQEVFYLAGSDTTLHNLKDFSSTDNNLLWGKIDSSKLANGKFKTDDFINDYGIIKTWDKAFLLYIAILVIFAYVVLLILCWIFKRNKQSPATQGIGTSVTASNVKPALTEEQQAALDNLQKQIEEQKKGFDTQLQEKNNEITTLKEEKVELLKQSEALTAEKDELQKQVGNALVDFQGLPHAGGKECIIDILNAYDKVLGGKSKKEFEKILKTEKNEAVKQFKEEEKFDIIKKDSDFLNKTAKFKKEAELINWLDTLRKTIKTLPEILSLKKIYQDLEKDEKSRQRTKDEIIVSLLSRVDEYAQGKELLPQFNDYKNQTDKYLQIKPTYADTQKQVSDFHNLCLKLQKKDAPDFWDRTALSVWAISQLAIPLLKTWKKEIWFDNKPDNITETLKSDLLQIYTTRYFLRDTDESKLLEDFKIALDKEIPQKIAEYNIYISQEANAKLNSIDTNLKNQLTVALEKIKKFDSTQEFNDRMWNNFVKDFLQKAPTLNEQSPIDKAWFFEQLFNIAYHTADYLEFIKNNRNIIYCYNYQFLHNNFDLSKTEHYNFQLNHIEKSTTYSNRIYKWADDLEIKQLKVLIEKYLVKP